MLKLARQNLHLAGSPSFSWVVGCIRIAQEAGRSCVESKVRAWDLRSQRMSAGAVEQGNPASGARATAQGAPVTPEDGE